MFYSISKEMKQRMNYLEKIDERDRSDGTPRPQRLCQVPPETGKFLALLLAGTPEGTCIEIGTSGGYSTLWLSLACREMKRKIITFETMEEKARLAREAFRLANIDDRVELVFGDARKYLKDYKNISFCFLDAWKDMYEDCYEMVIPRMVKGGMLVADNVISHKETLGPMIKRALKDKRVDALIIPIGSGELVCRKI